ncbi:MAG: cysteine desulfurase [Myxococcales bacterium]|nr:cysteine desulfurase [Myxococcales bacterium]
MTGLDVARVRLDFPILSREMNGEPLVYLDSAASAQKPRAVLEAIDGFYRENYANIHRGVYELSATATRLHDEARATVARFLGAADAREIVFTRNATEAINLVAQTYGRTQLSSGDEILITEMEHHANIVPWQMICQLTGAKLMVAPIDDRGVLRMDAFGELLSDRTRIVAVGHVSNALGTINPVEEIVSLAHRRGAVVLIDGAQAAPRFSVDMEAIGCDFYVFSSHKLYGPTGMGVLYGRADLLATLPPYQGGGDMIRSVSFEKTTYAEAPQRFEAGTPDIAGAIGLAAAIDYLEKLGLTAIEAHEDELLRYGTELLEAIPKVTIVGTAPRKTGVLSFTIEGAHPHDIGTVLDQRGVAIRAGHHCAQPLMDRLGVPATARASVGVYNTRDDLDRLRDAILETIELLT